MNMYSLAGEVVLAPGSWRKSITEKDAVLAIQVAAWLKKRGKSLRPKLNDEQKQQLEECFELMDADGSGAIDADELGAAFKLLGLQVKKAEIGQLLDEVDSDGSGEVEYPEFIEIMTSTLAKLAEKKGQQGTAGNQVPFALLATAYRRKRIMEGLISGDKEMTAQVVAIAKEASRRAAEEAAAHQAEEALLAARRRRGSHVGSEAAGSMGNHLASSASSSNNSTRSSSLTGAINSPGSSGSVENSRAAKAVIAVASGSLLHTLSKFKSLKANPVLAALEGGTGATDVDEVGASCGSTSRGSAGSASRVGLAALGTQIAALLGEEANTQLAEVLKLAVHKRMQQQRSPTPTGSAAATSPKGSSGWSSPLGGNSCTSMPAGSGEGTKAAAALGAQQHMTSKLQQRVLTQAIQVPKFSLGVARSGANSPTDANRSKGRGRSTMRSQANSPAPSLSGSVPAVAFDNATRSEAEAMATAPCEAKGRRGGLGISKSATDLRSPAAGSNTSSATGAVQFGDCTIHEHGAQQQQQQQQQQQLEGTAYINSGFKGSVLSSGNSVAASRSRSTTLGLIIPSQTATAVGALRCVAPLLPKAGVLSPTLKSDQQQQPWQQERSLAQQSSKATGRSSSANISASRYATVGTGSAAAVAASIAAGSCSGGDWRGGTSAAGMKRSVMSKPATLSPGSPVESMQKHNLSGSLVGCTWQPEVCGCQDLLMWDEQLTLLDGGGYTCSSRSLQTGPTI